ncbi:GNAT family N-acetyltransferase [uncultured Lactobacillus sp.]|uniref:GNAT family N-acetyltransferase n=1 Tax=uncultured Lactobacillus sp. TaxID=153152 RepID=UPI002803B037|nr:GNAT family N-acetyltransferase [uncultured Lactobacillus sp.]
MTWKTKKFDELTTTELYKILYLRTATFVVEQNRIYQEVDDKDPKAIHVFDMDENNNVLAYARIYLIEDGAKVSFGRVVTSKQARGKGLGRQLIKQIMAAINQYFPNKTIEIEAQKQVEGYYQKFGFVSHGKPFIFESTPHVIMTHAAV